MGMPSGMRMRLASSFPSLPIVSEGLYFATNSRFRTFIVRMSSPKSPRIGPSLIACPETPPKRKRSERRKRTRVPRNQLIRTRRTQVNGLSITKLTRGSCVITTKETTIATRVQMSAARAELHRVDPFACLDRLVDALRDLRRLLFDRRKHSAGAVVEAVVGVRVADVLDDASHEARDI